MIRRFLYELIGVHYVGPVQEVLQADESDTRRRMALDVCTGIGDWYAPPYLSTRRTVI